MSAPGSGKTTTLIQLINRIKDKIRVSVMEADIDSDVDAVKIKEATGVPSIQLHTGGMCHLDAEMTRQGLDNLNLEETDLVILENVGNLVCPAEFDTGATCNAMILSVPEGDDKPLKYPLMFTVCDLVIINKMDVVPYFDFDIERCKKYIHLRNPKAQIIPVSAKTGYGIDNLAEWLLKQLP
jgi:hydrogenase nickel incorporation protein HypB